MDPSSSNAISEQQALQMVNTYIVNTTSTLNNLAVDTQAELDNIMKTVERLQQQVELLERTVQQPAEGEQGRDRQHPPHQM